jgi:hypothetical protein
MSRLAHPRLGSARDRRAGFGVVPKRTSPRYRIAAKDESQRKVRDRADTLADTPDAGAPQT